MAPGKIVAMWNMDVIGVKDAVVYVETTPDVTNFIKRCARATGLFAAAPTAVYWPPSSYDDWQFYMAGVPGHADRLVGPGLRHPVPHDG